MPTRLDVLLQRRKSAAAGLFHRQITPSASSGHSPAFRRADRGVELRESREVMRQSYIKSLTISRGPAGAVNARAAHFPRCGKGRIPPDFVLFCTVIWQN